MAPTAWLHTVTGRSAPRLLRLGGEIDLASVETLCEQLQAVPDDDVIIDMSAVRFFSAAGVTLLLDLREHLRQWDHTLHLMAVPHVVHRVLDLLNLLPCWPTIAEATAVPDHRRPTVVRHVPASVFPPRQRGEAVATTLAHPDPLGQRASALQRYIAEVATTLGIPASACWCEAADHAGAYLALAQRSSAFPGRRAALG